MFALAALSVAASAAATAFADGEPVPNSPFVRRVATGEDSSPVNYYLAPGSSSASPLLLLVQGSGCEPLFAKGKKGLKATAGQDIVAKDARGRVAVMIVEKAGVTSEGPPVAGGTATDCPLAYNSAHSLPSWTARLSRALNDARRRKLISSAPIHLMGLSEGAVTIARLAHQRADVSQAIFISGFGCDQWRDVLVTARRDAEPGKEAEAVSAAEAGLREVASDPRSTSKLFDGQTHLFWSTFGSACPAMDLVQSKARVMVFTGTNDEQIDSNGVESITAAFLHARKPLVIRRVVGGTHILATDPKQPLANILDAFAQAVDWAANSK